MPICYHENTRTFHLYNGDVSYLMQVLSNGQMGQLYFGKKLRDREDFSYLVRTEERAMNSYTSEDRKKRLSLQQVRQEYPSYGTSDFRSPAFEIQWEDGSRVSDFCYASHVIFKGKRKLEGLPAVYVEEDGEADTLEITLADRREGARLILSYTIFRDYGVLARSVRIVAGERGCRLERVMSLNLDLPDSDFVSVQLSGAWARERYVRERRLEEGLQGVYSMRGASSSEHNPFLALRRPDAGEGSGEVYAVSLIYSGNHLELADVDQNHVTRLLAGIHPDTFSWKLEPGEAFQSPEAVLVYTDRGLNGMSGIFHGLYRTRLRRGFWRDRACPIIINNWETTGCDFTEEKILELADTAKSLGVEMLVLDDGWFGDRENDRTGLGDWYVTNFQKLPHGIAGLAEKVKERGLRFGLWFEPEMVNKDSRLFREHPDWILQVEGRFASPGRNQHVLDFSRQEVVDYIYDAMEKVLGSADISYIKWDMNRYITECGSAAYPADRQGELFHRYILGVYSLYERLNARFPEILFESCSSGGSRFDPGLLYYAGQTWTSDNTDAVERVRIQYGTSYVYPLCSMGAHVSDVPNQQSGRITSMATRSNVAHFGVFGYQMNLTAVTDSEKEEIRRQIAWEKEHRELIRCGRFYRLRDPFRENTGAWLVVSEDRREALVGYYQIYREVNTGWDFLKLEGLDPDRLYSVNGGVQVSYGDELMNLGILLDQERFGIAKEDYASVILHIKAV